jgi:hypothetical protein
MLLLLLFLVSCEHGETPMPDDHPAASSDDEEDEQDEDSNDTGRVCQDTDTGSTL